MKVIQLASITVITLVTLIFGACVIGPELKRPREPVITKENLIGEWRIDAQSTGLFTIFRDCSRAKEIGFDLQLDGKFKAKLPSIFFQYGVENLNRSTCALTICEGKWKLDKDSEGNWSILLEISGGGLTEMSLYQDKASYYTFSYLGDADTRNSMMIRRVK